MKERTALPAIIPFSPPAASLLHPWLLPVAVCLRLKLHACLKLALVCVNSAALSFLCSGQRLMNFLRVLRWHFLVVRDNAAGIA